MSRVSIYRRLEPKIVLDVVVTQPPADHGLNFIRPGGVTHETAWAGAPRLPTDQMWRSAVFDAEEFQWVKCNGLFRLEAIV
jgi:hypothetical protein